MRLSVDPEKLRTDPMTHLRITITTRDY